MRVITPVKNDLAYRVPVALTRHHRCAWVYHVLLSCLCGSGLMKRSQLFNHFSNQAMAGRSRDLELGVRSARTTAAEIKEARREGFGSTATAIMPTYTRMDAKSKPKQPFTITLTRAGSANLKGTAAGSGAGSGAALTRAGSLSGAGSGSALTDHKAVFRWFVALVVIFFLFLITDVLQLLARSYFDDGESVSRGALDLSWALQALGLCTLLAGMLVLGFVNHPFSAGRAFHAPWTAASSACSRQ